MSERQWGDPATIHNESGAVGDQDVGSRFVCRQQPEVKNVSDQ